MIGGIPLAVWLGILTIISLFTTASLGYAMFKYQKNVFKYHRFFAILTITLAIIHLIFAYLLWFKGVLI
jgi:hypothetical protein